MKAATPRLSARGAALTFAADFVDISTVSVIGSPLETSALQAIQAQQVASKARDREKAESASGRRFKDLVELRVSGVESGEAVRGLPQNDSEQAQSEHQGGQATLPDSKEHPHIDLKA